MECLICAEPSKHAHLGVNSCRACAVFYRRTFDSKTRLKCKDGSGECLTQNPKSTCRLCRFTRLNEIMMKARESENCAKSSELNTSESTIIEKIVATMDSKSDDSLFINHESFYDCAPSTSHTPSLERLRKGYSLMCLIRYSGEIATRTKSEDQVRVGSMILYPATYSTFNLHGNLCKQAMKSFANHAFDDFRELDEQSKNFIINTSYSGMNSIDSAYRCSHHFPNDDNVRTPGYTTYIRTQNLEQFFENCPDNIDTDKIVSELRKGFDRSVRSVRRFFKRMKPTRYEFLALLGLALWSDEIANVNEKMLRLAMRNRQLIMRDLHAYYSQQGIRNYAVRIGNLHCALVNFQNNVAKMHEDLQLYRLMNLFKNYYDNNCDRIF